MVTDLLQVVPTRLKQAVCNKLLQTCCRQPVVLVVLIKLLHTDNILEIDGTTCCESVGLVNLVTR